MIDDYYLGAVAQMQQLQDLHHTSILPSIPQIIESTLAGFGAYQCKKPPGYPDPNNIYETQGMARTLHKSKKGNYNNLPLRIGVTEMHITRTKRDRSLSGNDRKKNIEALVLVYSGNLQTTEPVAGTELQTTADSVIVYLLENGVVAGMYSTPRELILTPILPCAGASDGGISMPFIAGHFLSWYPAGKEGWAEKPFPENVEKVTAAVRTMASSFGSHQDASLMQVMADMVMLAVDVQKFGK